jgi:hypothetical protein
VPNRETDEIAMHLATDPAGIFERKSVALPGPRSVSVLGDSGPDRADPPTCRAPKGLALDAFKNQTAQEWRKRLWTRATTTNSIEI